VLQQWLDEVQDRGVKLGLERIRAALELAGRPQDRFPSLLVGGTNGKGSTVAFATALLNASGHRVGSTVSPHLTAYRERFRIDGVPIEQEALEALAATIEPRVRDQAGMEELTFFELGALLALSCFAEREVGAAIVEVGMGGEFDATRASEPRVAALVSVDLDHQKYLGETVEEIARTKARIAPKGGVLVTTEVREDRLSIIREEAASADCRLVVAGEDFEWRFMDGALDYHGAHMRLDLASLGLQGEHQGQNAACALAAVEALCHVTGLSAPDPWQAGAALRETRLPGRMERVRVPGGPAFLLDGAHNPAGAQALAAALADRRRPRERVWLVASMQDKERGPMLEALLPHVDRVVCTRGESSPRFEAPEALAEELTAAGARAEAMPTAREAAAALSRQLGSRDEVLVAGSLYLVGDVRAALGLAIG
jgi:dihydrofolate synthase / folylpolyglutamate synthase